MMSAARKISAGPSTSWRSIRKRDKSTSPPAKARATSPVFEQSTDEPGNPDRTFRSLRGRPGPPRVLRSSIVRATCGRAARRGRSIGSNPPEKWRRLPTWAASAVAWHSRRMISNYMSASRASALCRSPRAATMPALPRTPAITRSSRAELPALRPPRADGRHRLRAMDETKRLRLAISARWPRRSAGRTIRICQRPGLKRRRATTIHG